MMRQPTPLADLLRWHTAALAGEDVDWNEYEPHCGWYFRRLVTGGPKIPVRIWMLQETDIDSGELTEPEVLHAESLGEELDPVEIWSRCRPISRDAYAGLLDTHKSIPAMKDLHKPVDLSTTPVSPGGT